MLKLVLGLALVTLLIILILIFFFYRKRLPKEHDHNDLEINQQSKNGGEEGETEDLVTFRGGEDLTICDILDAPGEVIGKSNYGTLYKALLQRSGSVRLLRFLRPVCTTRDKEFGDLIELLGCIRHPNLVPLLGFYAGPRGEKLIVHPFYKRGNLAQCIRGEILSFCYFHYLFGS